MSQEVLLYSAIILALVAAGFAAAAWWQTRSLARAVRRLPLAELLAEARVGAQSQAPRLERLDSATDEIRRASAQLQAMLPQLESMSASLLQSATHLEPAGPIAVQTAAPIQPWADGMSVELVDRERLRRSPSLAPRAFLVPDRPEGAELYVNPEAAVDHVALREWQHFFEFRGEKPFVQYTTIEAKLK